MDHAITVPAARLSIVDRRARRDPTAPKRKRAERERQADGDRFARMLLPEARLPLFLIRRGVLTEDEAASWPRCIACAEALIVHAIDVGARPAAARVTRPW